MAETCVYVPDEMYSRYDEYDEEHIYSDLHSMGWSCSECGMTMLGGDDYGWFDTTTGKPSFSYCPYCGRKVDIEATMRTATSEIIEE